MENYFTNRKPQMSSMRAGCVLCAANAWKYLCPWSRKTPDYFKFTTL